MRKLNGSDHFTQGVRHAANEKVSVHPRGKLLVQPGVRPIIVRDAGKPSLTLAVGAPVLVTSGHVPFGPDAASFDCTGGA